MRIIGQEKLVEKLNSYTLATLPKTIMFLGESGCGKTLFANYLAERLDVDIKNIDEAISPEDLIDFALSNAPTIYVIDLDKFNQNQQNKFLKFIEEPGLAAYIILTACSEINILPTILNRCIKYQFEPYSIEQLKKFAILNPIKDERLYSICTTPGQIENIDSHGFSELYDLCSKIILNILNISCANVMSISTKINYKEEYEKYDFKTFINLLEYVAFDIYKNGQKGSQEALKVYNAVNKYKQKILNKSVIKENLILSMLFDIWMECV